MKKVANLLVGITMLASLLIPTIKAYADSNLVANPSVEIADTTGQPTNWTPNSWGNNSSSLTYANTGHSGAKSLMINMTSRTDGDAKWMPDAANVTAGTSYTYSDYYISNATTELDAALTDATGKVSYQYLGAVAPSATWQQTTGTLTIPTSIVRVQIMHILATPGTLQTDDFTFAPVVVVTPPPADPSTNLIPNASMEYGNTSPTYWTSSSWGSSTTAFNYVANDGHNSTKSAKVSVSNYVSGDAKWYFQPVTGLQSGQQYKFTGWYKTNAQIHAVGAYTDTQGTMHYFNMTTPTVTSAAATTWQSYKDVFTLPDGATSFTVFLLVSSNGWLQVDDYGLLPYTPTPFNRAMVTLTFDDGWESSYTNGLPLLKKYGFTSTQYIISGAIGDYSYMSSAQINAFKTQGSEIASHTINHPDLTTLSTTKIDTELSQSKTTLQKLFGSTAAINFATPYGSYNQKVITEIKKYYRSHRSTDVGFNSKDTFDPYNIHVQNVEVGTTPAQVAAWIDQANKSKTWLVLVYHNVDTSGDAYSVTPANLDTELSYIKSTGITVETLNQALDEIAGQQ